MRNSVAKSAVDLANADPELVERMKISLLGESFRKQINKEEVFKRASEDINSHFEENKNISVNDPDDDWLNNYLEYAENASSDRMRDVWAKVLSGKLRRISEYGPSALRAIAEMDSDTAAFFNEICLSRISYFIPRAQDETTEGKRLDILSELEAAGLISGTDGLRSMQIKAQPIGQAILGSGQWILIIRAPGGASITVPAYTLTRAGQQLASISDELDHEKALRDLAAKIQKPPATAIILIKPVENGQPNKVDILWEASPGAATAPVTPAPS